MSLDLLDRVPPQALDAEQCVLGSILLCADAYHDVADLLRPEAFYRAANQVIYRELAALVSAQKQPDIVTLHARLAELRVLDEVGGVAYLKQLFEATPTDANARAYADIVRDRAVRRCLCRTAVDLSRDAMDSPDSGAVVGQRYAARVAEVADRATSLPPPLADGLRRTLDAARAGGVRGWNVRMPSLARVLPRIRAGELVIVAGRPNHGKTSLLRGLARDLCADGHVAVFSVEEDYETFAAGLLAAEVHEREPHAQCSKRGILDGDSASVENAERVETDVAALPLTVDCESRDLGEIVARSRRIARTCGDLVAVVVDYLQIVRSPRVKNSTRDEQLGDITGELRALAKAVRCCVIVGCQLRKREAAHEQKPERLRPHIGELRESGRIEQDADAILAVHQSAKCAWGDDWRRGFVEVAKLKDRKGETMGGYALLGIDGARCYEPSGRSDPRRVEEYLRRAP